MPNVIPFLHPCNNNNNNNNNRHTSSLTTTTSPLVHYRADHALLRLPYPRSHSHRTARSNHPFNHSGDMSLPSSSPPRTSYPTVTSPHRSHDLSGLEFTPHDEDDSLSGDESSDYDEEEEEEEEDEEEDEDEEEEEDDDDDDDDDDDERTGEDNLYEGVAEYHRETFEPEEFDVDLIQTLTDLNPSSSSLAEAASGWTSPATISSTSVIPATADSRNARPTLSATQRRGTGRDLAGIGRGRVRGRMGRGPRDVHPTHYNQTRTADEERNNHPETRSPASSISHAIIPERSFIPAFVIDPHTSFLKAGRSFTGTQNLMSTAITVAGFSGHKEEWEVRVTINSVNLDTGTIIGLMEALNVPATATTVVTYWEGEIIDFINHTLWTGKWQADANIDLQHWRKFDAFKGMDDRTIKHGFRSARHIHQKYIFMRWKERFFVNMTAQDSGLTIAGFYYVCIRRSDGHIEGFYFDPSSTPYQKLVLHPWNEGRGVSFSDYSFA